MEVPVALVPDMAARGTVVEEPSLSPCTTTARESTLAHSQVHLTQPSKMRMVNPRETSRRLCTFSMTCSALNTRHTEDLVLEVQDPSTAIIIVIITIIIIAQKTNLLNIQMLKQHSLKQRPEQQMSARGRRSSLT